MIAWCVACSGADRHIDPVCVAVFLIPTVKLPTHAQHLMSSTCGCGPVAGLHGRPKLFTCTAADPLISPYAFPHLLSHHNHCNLHANRMQEGRHEELLAAGGVYAQLVRRQLTRAAPPPGTTLPSNSSMGGGLGGMASSVSGTCLETLGEVAGGGVESGECGEVSGSSPGGSEL